MVKLAVNVDIDRLKFLSTVRPEANEDLLKRMKLLEVKIGQKTYYSGIIYIVDLQSDHSYLAEIQTVLNHYSKKIQTELVMAGNGVEAHKLLLVQLFGEENFAKLPRSSQIQGIGEGLRLLLKYGAEHFYCLKGQSLLKIGSIRFNPVDLSPGKIIYPMLIVNVKGGVTFYRVDSPSSPPCKVLSSIFGEFCLAGMVKLFLNGGEGRSINGVLKQAWKEGANFKVDLTVGDIYGDGISQVAGLDKDIIASSMGKSRKQLANPLDLDYIFSALVMFGINIGNIGSLVVLYAHPGPH